MSFNYRIAKKSKIKNTITVIISLIMAVIAFLLVFLTIFWHFATPKLCSIINAKVKSFVTNAVNLSTFGITEGYNYNDFVTVTYADNVVSSITLNTELCNSVALKTSNVVYNSLCSLFKVGIDVPVGTLTCFALLSERGPNVNVAVSPVGNVTCNYSSSFFGAGINQTLHRVTLDVVTQVQVVMPTTQFVVDVSNSVLIAESVIVGKVPQYVITNCN